MSKPKSISRNAAAIAPTETVPVQILTTDMADLRQIAAVTGEPLPYLLDLIYAQGVHTVRRLYSRARAAERRHA